MTIPAPALAGQYKAIYADPPWAFKTWTSDARIASRGSATPYKTMTMQEISSLPVSEWAAPNCCLFLWVVWPTLPEALQLIEKWGFKYKTCAFSWIKANATQIDMFKEETETYMGLGYWTRANSEVCLLATRGDVRRKDAGVKQAIIEPRREHSRKPDCVPGRIMQLVDGPYLEMFARTRRDGWDAWGNQTDKFSSGGLDQSGSLAAGAS